MRPKTWLEAVERYSRLETGFGESILRLSGLWHRLAFLRGGLFIATGVGGLAIWQNADAQRTFWIAITIAVALAFLLLVYLHDQIEVRLAGAKSQATFFAHGVYRGQRQWNRLPVPALEPVHDFRSISRDLDLFGNASLAQLLSTVQTPMGLETIRAWLCTPASVTEIRQRQQAIEDLASATDWRERFQLTCAALAKSPAGPARFVAWSESRPWLTKRSAITWLARITAAVALILIVGFFIGGLAPEVAGFGLMAVVAVSFLVSVAFAGRVHEIFNQVSSSRNEVEQYLRLFRSVQRAPSNSTWMKNQRRAALGEAESTLGKLGSLSLIVWLGNLRRHGILFLAYIFLQLFCLWDVHVLAILESWQRRHGKSVRGWFDALARIEGVSALATLSYENPDWTVPKIYLDDPPRIEATGLGHPLLPNDVRVCNDVHVGPPNRVLLVTGSNMSGKSTLLRAIGTNVVLAQIGSVVCARTFGFYPVELETSMRISDSLSEGVSFFMAELKRLKEIVDHSELIRKRRRPGPDGLDDGETHPAMLFLLDEVLLGTNSRERHIAVNAVIHQLLTNGADRCGDHSRFGVGAPRRWIGRARAARLFHRIVHSSQRS